MYKRFFKRVLDLVCAVLALPVCAVILVVVAPLIYLEDKGTIFYNAPRLGKNGNAFMMYKFRSMKMNAPDIRNADRSTFNSERDPRLTRVGTIIRKLSLDETPQILNVLRGEMSFIGPRPDLPDALDVYQDDEIRKLEVLPGITGYSQAYHRNSVSLRERFQQDVYYVDHISLFFDLKVVLKTFQTVVLRKAIYRDQGNEDVEVTS